MQKPSIPCPPPADGRESEIFIGRQPILNSEQKIFAYELLFRSSAGARAAGVLDGDQATSRLLINTFNNFGVERVLGDKKAFINVTAGLLESDLLELLPADKVVLEVLEDVTPSPTVLERCRALKVKGYQLALDDFRYRAEFEPLLGLASFVKLDVRALKPAELGEHLRLLRGRGLRLIAEKVETRDEFKLLRAQLINYYQGYYFARPETLSMKRMDPGAQQLMQLFNLVIGNAEPGAIENGFRQDVALSYNLLRYINSVGFGLTHKVETIKRALVVLGNAKLARWLTLLLFSHARHNNPAPQALFRVAVTRARLIELLGTSRLGGAHQDYLFMTGMFSLLDAMLDTPLEESLKTLKLPPAVTEALLVGSGPYAPYLELSRACEKPDLARIEALAPSLGLTLADVTRVQMEALGWAEQVGSVA
jgi:EAL and modified HD-GYP domain-containing signal transduction protein